MEQPWVEDVHIEHVTFTNCGNRNVSLSQANGCSVTSCTFLGQTLVGISDGGTQTGNKYFDNTFDGAQFTTLSIGGVNFGDQLIIDCRASPGPSPAP